ncbi:16S rRNA (cytosine(1402)-N(4))-methyltransferase RsmH [Candidatus Dojkabacteria bacterium]|uniref:Ribosomal RNA small subunit methyltransferase H n=1 Tax=Candidatus Dojkabacteria bacterium TaxID=2099670 RepID=A0A847VCX6_9BACT|nr:16S rRNA (cytosine(1402)-N(4))-methyltransferase RsmH [Candidatus Dojkabacteria bacterium]
MDKVHVPVLLKESLNALNINPTSFYIDCTLGDGGHSIEILRRLNSEGLLLSIDQDRYAIDFVKRYYKDEIKSNWHIVESNFAKLDEILLRYERKPDGILIDLGLSSRQLEKSHNRGFSYLKEEEPLDMRMSMNLEVKAKDLLLGLTEKELTTLFRKYGEERYANRIAKEIKKNITDIDTVGDLTRLVYRVVPAAHQSSKNPSRRVFQALRIAVNDELNSLKKVLDISFKFLNSKGRICVISFHSLEDRIVKDYFNSLAVSGEGVLLSKEVIAPTEEEAEINPRSASAKLRIIEKI